MKVFVDVLEMLTYVQQFRYANSETFGDSPKRLCLQCFDGNACTEVISIEQESGNRFCITLPSKPLYCISFQLFVRQMNLHLRGEFFVKSMSITIDTCSCLKTLHGPTKKEYIKFILRQDGCALARLPNSVGSNAEAVYTAVCQNGNSLAYASAKLKSDRAIVLKAVNQAGSALEHADPVCQANLAIVLIAVLKNREALQYAGRNLNSYLPEIRENPTALLEEKFPYLADFLAKPCDHNTADNVLNNPWY